MSSILLKRLQAKDDNFSILSQNNTALINVKNSSINIQGATSTSTITGALTVSGGVGITDGLFVNGPGTFQKGNGSLDFTWNQLLLGFSDSLTFRHAIKTRHDSLNNNNNAFDFYVWQTTDLLTDIGTKHVVSITGTGFGINNTSPINALDVSGTARITGNTSLTSTTTSTSVDTGAIVITGGAGIGGTLNIGGVTRIVNTSDVIPFPVSFTEVGALQVLGGSSIKKSLSIGENLYVFGGGIMNGGWTVKGSMVVGDEDVVGPQPFSQLVSYGNLRVLAETGSSGITSGAIVVSGGVGIGSELNVGGETNLNGICRVLNTTVSSSTTTGALSVSGGVGILGAANVGGIVKLTNTADDPDVIDFTPSGALQVLGGSTISKSLCIGENLFVFGGGILKGNLSINNTLTVGTSGNAVPILRSWAPFVGLNSTASTNTTTGAITTAGGVGIVGNLNVGGNTNVVNLGGSGISTFTSLAESSSVNTGAVIISGGVGIAGDANIQSLKINDGISVNSIRYTGGNFKQGVVESRYAATDVNNFANESLFSIEFMNKTPWSINVIPQINADSSPDNTVILFKTFLYITTAGAYTFGTNSDDASDIFVDGKLVADWYGLHALNAITIPGGNQRTMNLSVGFHRIISRLGQGNGGIGIYTLWKQPGDTDFSQIPQTSLFYDAKDLVSGTTNSGILLGTTTTSTDTTSGALVVRGGVGIAENVNIGGSLSFGTISGVESSPSISTVSVLNTASIIILNSKMIKINTNRTLYSTFRITPTAANTRTVINFNIPEKTTVSQKYDIVGCIQGWSSDNSTIQNMNVFGDVSNNQASIQFTSVNTLAHDVQIVLNYMTN